MHRFFSPLYLLYMLYRYNHYTTTIQPLYNQCTFFVFFGVFVVVKEMLMSLVKCHYILQEGTPLVCYKLIN